MKAKWFSAAAFAAGVFCMAVSVHAEVKVEDMSGRMIEMEDYAERIVALSPADCEIIYELGAGDKIVGRGEYCDYPAEVLEIPAVNSGADTNIEQILALKPDLLVMSTMAQSDEQIAALEAAGVKVAVSDAQNIEGVYTAIDLIGALLGKEEEANAMTEEMKTSFEELKTMAAEKEPQSIYFEVSPLEWGLWAAGKNTFMDEIAEMLNLKNIFSDVNGWAEVSEEQVIERAPENIMTITMYFGEGDTPAEEILGRAGWGEIPAVVNQKILNLVDNELSRPAPRLVDGAQALYEFVYGE